MTESSSFEQLQVHHNMVPQKSAVQIILLSSYEL